MCVWCGLCIVGKGCGGGVVMLWHSVVLVCGGVVVMVCVVRLCCVEGVWCGCGGTVVFVCVVAWRCVVWCCHGGVWCCCCGVWCGGECCAVLCDGDRENMKKININVWCLW